MTLQDVINDYKERQKEHEEKYSDRPLKDYLEMKAEQERNLKLVMNGMRKQKEIQNQRKIEKLSPTGGLTPFKKK